MNNEVTNFASDMGEPKYLQQYKGGDVGSALSAGISAGGHARLSIKSARFRLVSSTGEEQVVPTAYLDVFIVGANANISKTFYESKYMPGVDVAAPDCFSDNGKTPSPRSLKPQCATCAGCKNNVWGSRIAASGEKAKLCADSKKIALLLADNPTGEVYELRIPAMSLRTLAEATNKLSSRGYNVSMAKFRLSFDPKAEYPRLEFTGIAWAEPEVAKIIDGLVSSDEVKRIVSMMDEPVAEGWVDKMVALPAYVVAHTAAPAEEPVVEGDQQVKKTRAKKAVAGVVTQPEMVSNAELEKMLDGAFDD